MPRDHQQSHTCPNCKKALRMGRGLRVHLGLSVHCQAYRRNKLEGLRVTHQNHHPQDQEEEEIIETVETPEELLQPIQDREVSPEDVVKDFHE